MLCVCYAMYPSPTPSARTSRNLEVRGTIRPSTCGAYSYLALYTCIYLPFLFVGCLFLYSSCRLAPTFVYIDIISRISYLPTSASLCDLPTSDVRSLSCILMADWVCVFSGLLSQAPFLLPSRTTFSPFSFFAAELHALGAVTSTEYICPQIGRTTSPVGVKTLEGKAAEVWESQHLYDKSD
ncbi:hypothetical protein C8R43DRAFT_492793 [Mycena crocata]|nr:hypothetical protein C8R43DRAFT_492793 [Mycena crocata]